MAVVGMVSRSKVLLMVDLNRVFSLANLIGTGICHERLQCRHASGVQDTPLAPPPEAAPTSTSSYTTSVRSSATASSSPSPTSSSEVLVQFKQGLPQVTVPLPSRREFCRFTLRPVSNTVGDFLSMMQQEDRGIDRVAILTEDGVRIASSNTIESLFQEDFKLVINDREYNVQIPKLEKANLSKDDIERLSDVRSLVNQLYEALNVEEHQIKKERELLCQLEELKSKLEPLEKKRQSLEAIAIRRTTVLTWAGLGLMSVQFGILARLTWWEYSWDIMEPVTYFVTYGTAMAAYAYFVLTKQEYLLPDVKDREHLLVLHKRARKIGLNINQYNVIKDEILRIEYDLARLRDPLQLHLPTTRNIPSIRPISYNQVTTMEKLRTMFGRVIKDKEKA